MTGLILLAFGVAKYEPTTTISNKGLSASSSVGSAARMSVGAMAPMPKMAPTMAISAGACRAQWHSLNDEDAGGAPSARYDLLFNMSLPRSWRCLTLDTSPLAGFMRPAWTSSDVLSLRSGALNEIAVASCVTRLPAQKLRQAVDGRCRF